MSVTDLREDLLYVFTFGPGIGESIVVRVPPDKWVVVDGCQDGRLIPAVETLRANGGSWSCVVFSHPHDDHAQGLEAVLSLPGSGPVGCVRPMLPDLNDLRQSADPRKLLTTGTVEQLLSKIDDIWEKDPAKMWNMRQGEKHQIGDAVLTALHPDAAAINSSLESPNGLSTPILIEWNNVKLLLGADLPKREWDAVGERIIGLADHTALKIPHHGSAGSVSASFCGKRGDGNRFWVLTPYSPQRLPRFSDTEGLAQLLKYVDRVHMSALPQQRKLHGLVPFEAVRSDLRDGKEPTPVTTQLGTGLVATDFTPSSDALRCYVIVGIDSTGTIQDLRHGPGSVTVREER